MNKKKILHLCSWFPNRRHPFEGNFIHKHIRTLEGEQYQNIAVAVFPFKISKGLLFEIEEGVYDQVPYFIIYHRPVSSLLNVIIRFVLYFYAIQKVSSKYGRFDLIHAHVFNYAGIFMYFYSFISAVPYVVTEHQTYFQIAPEKQNFLLKYLIRKSAATAKLILPVSDDLKNRLLLYKVSGPFKVIPNVVNTNLFYCDNQKRGPVLKLLHISSFHPNKNIPGLLRVIKALSKKRDDFILTIAGDGDLEYVNQLIHQNNIHKERILLYGKRSEQEVAQLMKEHDCIVLFSDFENLPCVLLEAQCSGLPIISTDIAGIKEIVPDNKYGTLIEKGNESELLQAIIRLMDIDNCDPQMISKRGIAHYSEEAVYEKLHQVYLSVTG